MQERTGIELQMHGLVSYGGRTFALIYVPSSPHKPLIFAKDGQYKSLSADSKRSTDETLFRSGDIFIRKGASSCRVDQSDMRRLISDIRRREQDAWTENLLGIQALIQRVERLISSLPSTGGENPPVDLASPQPFDDLVSYVSRLQRPTTGINLMDGQQAVAARRFILGAPTEFYRAIPVSPVDDNILLELRDNRILPMLDHLTKVSVEIIRLEAWSMLNDVQQALYFISERASDFPFPAPSDPTLEFGPAWVWREVMIRVYTLGAILIRRNHLAPARRLIEQEVGWDNHYRTAYWSKYTTVMASRANLLDRAGLVRLVVAFIKAHSWLKEEFVDAENRVVAAVCQFDFLQCLLVALNNKEPYPSFGAYFAERTEPLITKLIEQSNLRASLPDMTDQQLADHIRRLAHIAGRIFWDTADWSDGEWSDPRISAFLRRYPAPNSISNSSGP